MKTVKYNANWDIMNTYENLQIVLSQFFINKQILVYIGLIQISIGLSVLEFDSREPKWKAIRLHSTICIIWSPIPWAKTKVIKNYLPLPSQNTP